MRESCQSVQSTPYCTKDINSSNCSSQLDVAGIFNIRTLVCSFGQAYKQQSRRQPRAGKSAHANKQVNSFTESLHTHAALLKSGWGLPQLSLPGQCPRTEATAYPICKTCCFEELNKLLYHIQLQSCAFRGFIGCIRRRRNWLTRLHFLVCATIL